MFSFYSRVLAYRLDYLFLRTGNHSWAGIHLIRKLSFRFLILVTCTYLGAGRSLPDVEWRHLLFEAHKAWI